MRNLDASSPRVDDDPQAGIPADWRPADGNDSRDALLEGMLRLQVCVLENINEGRDNVDEADNRIMLVDALAAAFKAYGRPSASYVLPGRAVTKGFGKTEDAWKALVRAYVGFASDHAYRCLEMRVPRVFFVRYPGTKRQASHFQLWVCTSNTIGADATCPPFVVQRPIRYAQSVPGRSDDVPAPPALGTDLAAQSLVDGEPEVEHTEEPAHSVGAQTADDRSPAQEVADEVIASRPNSWRKVMLQYIVSFPDNHPTVFGLSVIALLCLVAYTYSERFEDPYMKFAGPLLGIAALASGLHKQD